MELIQEARKLGVEPYEDTFTDAPLMSNKPEPLAVMPQAEDKGQVREYVLNNNIRLVVKAHRL
ncbi:MAG: hypothetical protein IPM52_10245 [Bacteroidetes bacterium]|nr:hypothetical protein [Bacteroidota bacterium]